jgi:hypothetical protein
MSWVRRHPFAAAIFGLIFLFFVLVAIVESEDEERGGVILGLVIIYVLLVAVYAFVAWLYGKIFGRSESQIPVPPMPSSAQQQFPQWDWATRSAMPPSAASQAPVPITCQQCGSTNPPGSVFCDQCGARLANGAAPPPGIGVPNFAPVPPPVGAVECPRCHTRLSPGVRFCTNCGLPRSSV